MALQMLQTCKRSTTSPANMRSWFVCFGRRERGRKYATVTQRFGVATTLKNTLALRVTVVSHTGQVEQDIPPVLSFVAAETLSVGAVLLSVAAICSGKLSDTILTSA